MNKLKGDLYEDYVRDHIMKNLNKQAFLWKDTPEEILIKSGIFNSHQLVRLERKEIKNNPNCFQDTGIDIIQIDNLETNKLVAIQCKNGYTNGLTINDLAGFSWMLVNNLQLNGHVYFTSKLSKTIRDFCRRIEFYKLPFMPNNSVEQIGNYILNKLKNKKSIKNEINYIKQILDQVIIPKLIKPFEYQVEAYNKIITHYETNNKAILSLPCGCGKTYTSWMISNNFDKVILISPLKQFAKTELDKI